MSLEVRSEAASGDAGLTVEVGSANGILVVIDPGEGDGFLAEVLGAFDLSVRAGLTLTWSSSSGVHLGGQSGFDVTLPLDLAVGPLRVATVRLALIGGSDGATIEAAATGGLVIGPFSAVVEDIGLRVALDPRPGWRRLRLHGPDAGIQAADRRRVRVRPRRGRSRRRVRRLRPRARPLHRRARARPGQRRARRRSSSSTRGCPAIPTAGRCSPASSPRSRRMPLGFGFFLSGVGGLVCLNRTLDEDALAAGLESGAIDAILFPDDPLEEAPLILSQLDAWFPLAPRAARCSASRRRSPGAPRCRSSPASSASRSSCPTWRSR